MNWWQSLLLAVCIIAVCVPVGAMLASLIIGPCALALGSIIYRP